MAAALSAGDETEARRLVALIVSRDPASLDITRAATEPVLENGNDAVFGALFWFAVADTPGVVVYRLRTRWTRCGVTATGAMSISALRQRVSMTS